MSYDQIDALRHWKLLKGSHEFPGGDGGTCINEAAIVAAGMPYREVCTTDDLPECFSRSLGYFAMLLNDAMRSPERQRLVPFVVRLAGTADTIKVERQRRMYIINAIVLKMIPCALRAIGRPDDADVVSAAQRAWDAPLTAIGAHILVPNQGVGLTGAECRRILGVREAILNADWCLHASAPFSNWGFPAMTSIKVCQGEHRKTVVDEGIGALDGALAIGRKADPVPEQMLINNLRYRVPQYAGGGL